VLGGAGGLERGPLNEMMVAGMIMRPTVSNSKLTLHDSIGVWKDDAALTRDRAARPKVRIFENIFEGAEDGRGVHFEVESTRNSEASGCFYTHPAQ
jgi:hypothetical protein